MARTSVAEDETGATAATTGRASQPTTGRLRSVMVREADWQQTKRAAVFAGLDFLRGLGGTLFRNDALWNRHGSDILIPFYVPPLGAPRASEEERHALRVATELALVWRGRNRGRRLTSGTPPSELLDLMQGVYTLECLGMADGSRDLRQQLEERCAAYGVEDFLRFDPAAGVPNKHKPATQIGALATWRVDLFLCALHALSSGSREQASRAGLCAKLASAGRGHKPARASARPVGDPPCR